MSLDSANRAARKADSREALAFPPAPLAVGLVEQGADANARAHRDRLDVFDLADDLELHAAILNDWCGIRKSG